MLRIFSKWCARLSYIFRLEFEAAKSDISAQLAQKNAQAKRGLVTSLNAEADAIENNIKAFAEREEKGFWLCVNGHETTETSSALNSDKSIPMCSECGKPAKFIKRELMSGQEKYESDKERKDAEQIAASKRAVAKQEAENVSGGEQAAQHFRGLAANARETADKIRQF